jgi:type IV pilus assembly protein PilM
MSIFDTTETAFGLDISDRSLRLIQLSKKRVRSTVQLHNLVKLPKDCISSGEILNPDVFLTALKKLIKTKRGKGQLSREAVVALPESRTFLKMIEIPSCNESEIENKIKNIIPKHVPLDVADTRMDWQIINESADSIKLLVGAVSKKIADNYTEILLKAKLMPVVLEVEPVAILRTINPVRATKDVSMVIDFGASRTGLFIAKNDSILFTASLPISGQKITESIAKQLDMTINKAEAAKIVCGLDKEKCHGALLEIFGDTILELAKHIDDAIKYYNKNFGSKHKVQKIIICGGGANFINIEKVLSQKLNMPVTISNPWENIINPDPEFFTKERSQSYVTAMGLAIRGLDAKNLL